MRWLALVMLVAGCADDLCAAVHGSCLELEVRGRGAIDQIILDSVELGLSFARSPEIASRAFPLPVRLAVKPLPHQGLFSLDVDGRLGGVSVGRDTVFDSIVPGQHLKIFADLESPTADLARAPDDLAIARDFAVPRDLSPPPPDLTPTFHWVRDTSMTFPSLETVWGSSPTNVYVAGGGGTIFHWDGFGWSPQSSGKSHVFQIHGASASHIYAGCSFGIVFSTGNGSWTSQFDTADITGIFDAALNSQIGGSSSSFFMRSTGNGSWSNVTNPAGSNALSNFWGSSGIDLYAGGIGTTIYHTTNGTTFNPESIGGSGLVLGLFGTGPTDVWALQENAVLHSTGNGTWQRQTSGLPSSGQVWGIGGFSGDLYVSGGAQKVFHSTGNGSWTTEVTPILAIDVALDAVFATSRTDIWVVGGNGSSGVVLHKFVAP